MDPSSPEHRPSLELRGHWQNPNLVMDDGGSLSRAFLPDGRLYTGHERNHLILANPYPLPSTMLRIRNLSYLVP